MSKDNLVKTATKPKNVSDGPTLRWDPKTGDATLYKTSAEAPAGSLSYNPNDPEAAAKANPVSAAAAVDTTPGAASETTKPTLTKAETIATLKSAGIAHSPNTSHSDLYNLLLTSIKSGLDEAKIVYDKAETDAKKLLGLFPSS